MSKKQYIIIAEYRNRNYPIYFMGHSTIGGRPTGETTFWRYEQYIVQHAEKYIILFDTKQEAEEALRRHYAQGGLDTKEVLDGIYKRLEIVEYQGINSNY